MLNKYNIYMIEKCIYTYNRNCLYSDNALYILNIFLDFPLY